MLKQILNEKIKNSLLEDIKKELGYQSIKKLQNTIDKFIESKTIFDWLNSGFYDLVNNAEDFLVKLCNVYEIEEVIVQKEIINFQRLRVEIEKFKDTYIFVNTNFKRKNEPIFTLALLENKRRISLYKDEKFLFKSVDEILELVSIMVVEHYKLNNGKCFIWGNIVNYQLKLFGSLYTFSKNGTLVDESNNLDINIATLSI